MIANIRIDMIFDKPLSVLKPLAGVMIIKCDCGRKQIGSEQITEKSFVPCFTCPKCGIHLCVDRLTEFRDQLFSKFRQSVMESN